MNIDIHQVLLDEKGGQVVCFCLQSLDHPDVTLTEDHVRTAERLFDLKRGSNFCPNGNKVVID